MPDHKIPQWLSPTNKMQLIRFISQEWQKERLIGKTLFLTTEEKCFEITSERTKYREDLMSTRDEADTQVLLHAAHAAAPSFKAVVVASEDTDVFVLCLAFKNLLPCKMFVKSSKHTRTVYTDISKVVLALGCDSVSAFFGKGKVAALKIGMRWELSDDLLVKLQEFTCVMYTSSPGTSYVNELRCRYDI